MYILFALLFLVFLYFPIRLIQKKITVGIWSIKVFQAQGPVFLPPDKMKLMDPTLKAADVTDVPAEFIADPFIITHDSKFYMFFEVLEKSLGRGVIGLATSEDGDKWMYERIVLRQEYHLSYPHVFIFENQFYMIPESSEAQKVLLYKAKRFPYEWDLDSELLHGSYVDSSIFQFNDRWWMFAAKSGKLHLFFSSNLKGDWVEHPQSPIISNNYNITRPGGRVIVHDDGIYRYTQDGQPNYGSAVKVFRILELSELKYQEEEVALVLNGTRQENDWRKDGMHTIDQLKISDEKWLIAVDGHKLVRRRHLMWKIDNMMSKRKAWRT